ncbi:MAG: cell filamentation protein Fic, partial [Paludibacteraceae bacterium]|nr:cell filamentation protein Fic [Paludibacteraceae bacterium]
MDTYYETIPAAQRSDDEEEADKVSLHITQVLSEKTFTFSPAELANIHRRLFTGVLPHAGRYREVNITKKEWVLNGDTVLYASYDAISATLAYDFEQERRFSYKHLTREQMVA